MYSSSLRLSVSIYFYRSPMSFLPRNRRRSEALRGFWGQNWCLTGFLGHFKEKMFFRSDGEKIARKSSFCSKYLNFVLPPPLDIRMDYSDLGGFGMETYSGEHFRGKKLFVFFCFFSRHFLCFWGSSLRNGRNSKKKSQKKFPPSNVRRKIFSDQTL